MLNPELYCYLASEYYATGEGCTICLLITRRHPESDDLDDQIDSFKGRFGFYAEHLSVLDRSQFLELYSSLVPAHVVDFLTKKSVPADFCWSCEFYFNYA